MSLWRSCWTVQSRVAAGFLEITRALGFLLTIVAAGFLDITRAPGFLLTVAIPAVLRDQLSGDEKLTRAGGG
eukprot:14773524-Heterocapsa_arctica.AAC.1